MRDGGFAFEDARKNAFSSGSFSPLDVEKIALGLSNANIDIIEMGAVEVSDNGKTDMAIYSNLEDISKTIPRQRKANQMYTAFLRGPDIPISDIPLYAPSYCDTLRVVIRYSEIQKSLEYCKQLVKKNYKVFIQPMVTMRFTPEEIQTLIKAANDMGAYAIYIVDTYGYMMDKDIKQIFSTYDKGLDASIKIGFHAHNNTNLALSNSMSFINQNSERDLVLDSCCLGMGQGAGNLQTELITDYLNKHSHANYDYDSVLDTCETIDQYSNMNLWGYSLARLLPAIHNTAYKFSVDLRENYRLSFKEINHILKNIPEKFRHRYTQENTEELLRLFGYKKLLK